MTDPQTERDEARDEAGGTRHDLSSLPVRSLLALLSEVETALRRTPFLIRRRGAVTVNPEIASLMARQRALVAQLRARRRSWRRGASHGGRAGPDRQSSASWPPPPWD